MTNEIVGPLMTETLAVLSRRPLPEKPSMDLDALYREYSDLCADRGVFSKGRNELHHAGEGEWLRYVISLIRRYPSREERKVTLE